MKSIYDRLIYPEIAKILNNKATKVRRKEVKLILHTKKHDILIPYFVSLEIYEDFINHISDYILVTFMIPLGDFVKVIYPLRDNLEITILNDYVTRRYKLIILNDTANFARYANQTQEDLNKQELTKIEAQCLDRVVEVLRTKTDTGIYRDTTVKDVITHTLLDGLSSIRIDGEYQPTKLTITPPNNIRKYNHIIIPNATKVIDVPTYLQETAYGVYNGGIGLYYQQTNKYKLYPNKEEKGIENHLFVYPIHKTNIVNKAIRKLAIYKIPNTQLHQIQNSFVIDNDLLKIVVDETTDTIDTGDKEYMNYGEAFNTIDPNSVMNRPHKASKGQTPTINYNEHTYNQAIKKREDGVSLSRTVNITDNMYRERSKILRTLGSLIKFNWYSADIEFLYPGMPVLYTMMNSFNQVEQYQGILHHVYNKIDNNFESVAILTVYLNKIEG